MLGVYEQDCMSCVLGEEMRNANQHPNKQPKVPPALPHAKI